MKTLRNRISIAASALVAIAALSSTASAALITHTQVMGGFSYDSDVTSGVFNTALGGGYSHISFAGATNSNGASYSPSVTFSTSAGVFGGSNTGSVNASNEIGPFGSWDGILNVDFNGNYVSAVGFGLVVFDSSVEIIRVFDTSNALIGTFNNQLGSTFSLWGVEATAGEQIGRLELDGNFFAIQDISFSQINNANVPDTGSTLVLLALGFLSLGVKRRRKA